MTKIYSGGNYHLNNYKSELQYIFPGSKVLLWENVMNKQKPILILKIEVLPNLIPEFRVFWIGLRTLKLDNTDNYYTSFDLLTYWFYPL
jgi:hypothetical protein